MQNKHLIKDFTYVLPGSDTQAVLDKAKGRYLPLHKFKKTASSMCGWCNAVLVEGKVKKYCSSNCRESAQIHCYPQSPGAKAYVLINIQNCMCPGCGEIFEDEIDQIIEKKYKTNQRYSPNDTQVEYYQIGKSTGHKWHVDHTLPVYKGGSTMGFDNIKVLCVLCHKKKTVEDVKR